MPATELTPPTPADPTALLFYAVLRGDTAQVEAALNAGASANEPQRIIWKVAEQFAEEGKEKHFTLFFAFGTARSPDPLIAPPRPPLYFAVKRKHYDTALLLLDRGANPNWTAPPIHEEIGDSFALLPHAVRGDDVRLVSALLRAGADVNHATAKGMTALRVAVKMGNVKLVRLLLGVGADAAFVAPNGVSLLMEAAGHGVAGFDLDSSLPGEVMGSFSLRRTAKNQGMDEGLSAVPSQDAEASPDDYAEIAALLVQHGANVNAVVPPSDGKHGMLLGITALQAAANVNNVPLVRLLLRAGADPNAGGNGMMGGPLLCAVSNDKARDMVFLLHEYGAIIHAANSVGCTPLMMAAAAGQADLIPVLLGWGADINARCYPGTLDAGFDALIRAAQAGRTECAALLLDAGITLDARDRKGRDALMIAAQWRRADMVRLLLLRGADPTRQSDDGKTAWDWAQTPTIASRMAGRLGEKYGTTPDQVVQNVKTEITAEVKQHTPASRHEPVIAEAMEKPAAIFTDFIQNMQNNANDQLHREAEKQAEILAMLQTRPKV